MKSMRSSLSKNWPGGRRNARQDGMWNHQPTNFKKPYVIKIEKATQIPTPEAIAEGQLTS